MSGSLAPEGRAPLQLLSVVIPARDEEACISSTVERLHEELLRQGIPHEIVVVDDGSSDRTGEIVTELARRLPEVRAARTSGRHGFGRAVARGLDVMGGDGVVIMMADESDDCRDVVRYWEVLQDGYDCVFGSRFVAGGGAIGYPAVKRVFNRLANHCLRLLFRIPFNDLTNAFKAFRREAIDGCRPLISPDFNFTIELALKAVIRGYRWKGVPVTWRNRRAGAAKFAIKEMGSRYLSVTLYLWLEKRISADEGKR